MYFYIILHLQYINLSNTLTPIINYKLTFQSSTKCVLDFLQKLSFLSLKNPSSLPSL
jgi:hypothetical protein